MNSYYTVIVMLKETYKNSFFPGIVGSFKIKRSGPASYYVT